MADLSINITAHDEASQSLQNTRKGLEDVGKAAKDASKEVNDTAKSIDGIQQSTNKANSYLESARQRFEKITSSTRPAKQQLKELQNIMANLNLKGLSNTSEFTQIAQEAGRIKDAMSDAARAIKAYSSDNLNLQAAAQGFQAITAAGTIATGVMGLFGSENKEIHELLLKVQSAQAILNGVNTIANAINKDSVLMLKLKQIALAAKTSTQKVDTVVTAANTVAQNVNTASIKKATAAQTAYNTAKALGKALLGDFTGVLLLGIGVLTTYAMVTNNATDAQEEHNATLDAAAQKQENYSKVAADTYANLMTKYTQLKMEWEKLSSSHEKNQWIIKNKTALDELAISNENVASVEAAFSSNTNAVVQGFVARAKAAAYLAELTDEYRKQMQIIDKMNTVQATLTAEAASRPKVAPGQEITDSSYWNSRYGEVNSAGKWVFHQRGAELHNGSNVSSNPTISKLNSELEASRIRSERLVKQIAETSKNTPSRTYGTSGGHHTTPHTSNHSTNTNTDKKPDYLKGSINDMKNSLKELEDSLANGLIEEKNIDEAKKRMKELRDAISKEEIRLGLREPEKQEIDEWANSTYNQLQKSIEKKQKQLQNDDSLSFDAKVKLATEIADLQKQIDNITNLNHITIEADVQPVAIVKGSDEDKRISYENANQKASRIQHNYEIGIIGYKEAKQQLKSLNDDLATLGIKPIKIELETNFDKVFNDINNGWSSVSQITDGINGVVSAFEKLKNAQNEGNNAWQTLINIIGIVDSLFNAFGATMESIKTIQEVLSATTLATSATETAATEQSTANAAQQVASSATITAAKSGEAIAGAAASGAKMPFPYNLIAIAAGVAAVIAALASIKKFAGGGIIKGQTSLGDMNIARVNNGEMILNGRQQSNLFKMINDGKTQSSNNQIAGNVVFEISGSSLKGVLRNIDNKMNKVT